MRSILVFLIVVVAVAGGGYWYWQRSTARPVSFKTVAVHRGDLQLTISATGTVEPEEVVDIGAQVAGQVQSLGTDPRDPSRGVQLEDGLSHYWTFSQRIAQPMPMPMQRAVRP